MDKDISINDKDEPWENYRKLVEINHRIQHGIPLKTDEKKTQKKTKYDKILFFVNKLLKQQDKQINGLSGFKSIRADFFKDKDELKRIITKYGVPLVEELEIEYEIDKKNPDVFKLLKNILDTIAYTIRSKRFKTNGKKYYTITEKKSKFSINELIDPDIYLLRDDEYEL